MARNGHRYITQRDFRGGINTEPENAQPNQVLDARNVWAPEGQLIQRPGFEACGMVTYFPFGSSVNIPSAEITPSTKLLATWDVNGDLIGTGASTYTVGVINEGEYFGALASEPFHMIGVRGDPGNYTPGAVASRALWAEYWNGEEWITTWGTTQSSYVTTQIVPPYGRVGVFSNLTSGGAACFTMGETTRMGTGVPGVASDLYAVRWKISDTLNDIGILSTSLTRFFQGQSDNLHCLGAREAQYSGGRRYMSVTQYTSDTVAIYYMNTLTSLMNRNHVSGGGIYQYGGYDSVVDRIVKDTTFQLVAVPVFNRSYVNLPPYINHEYDHLTEKWSGRDVGTGAGSLRFAERTQVETAEEIVGSIEGFKQAYHPDYVAQYEEWPKAKYWLYYKETLICAHLESNPYTVQWSAPGTAYKVWPEESFEFFGDDDNSPITGLSSLGEHVVVFREDSIWLLVDAGINDLGIQTFAPVKIVDGVGCIAADSIQRVQGKLIFMAEDGVYAFDGQGVQKLSETIDSVFSVEVNRQRRSEATACHFRTKYCYILSLASIGSADRDLTLIFDYKHNAWWRWDGLVGLQNWMVAEDSLGDEALLYIDKKGYVHAATSGVDHYAPVEAYIQTHRLGYGDFGSKRFREIYIDSTNKQESLEIKLAVNDEDMDNQDEVVLTFPSPKESQYGESEYSFDFYRALARRSKGFSTRKTGEWAIVEVANKDDGAPMILNGISIGAFPLGKR